MTLIPVVNMDAEMGSRMYAELCKYETICAVTQKFRVSEDDVKSFLGPLLAKEFKPEFLSLVA